MTTMPEVLAALAALSWREFARMLGLLFACGAAFGAGQAIVFRLLIVGALS